jgi:hypothetical protein
LARPEWRAFFFPPIPITQDASVVRANIFHTGWLLSFELCDESARSSDMDERDLLNLWPILLAVMALGAGIALLTS